MRTPWENFLFLLSLFKLPRVDDLGNPLNGEAASDFEEDLNAVDEEEHHHHEHQRGVAPVEDVAVELVVLAINSWGYPRDMT